MDLLVLWSLLCLPPQATSQAKAAIGSSSASLPTTMAWADFDRDGLQDVYIIASGAPDRLLRNRGDAHFDDLSGAALPVTPPTSRSAGWADYDHDGWPDLYLASKDGRGTLLHNLAGRHFENLTTGSGLAAVSMPHDALWMDYDADGWMDLVLQGEETQAIFHNTQSGTFQEITLPRPSQGRSITDPVSPRALQPGDGLHSRTNGGTPASGASTLAMGQTQAVQSAVVVQPMQAATTAAPAAIPSPAVAAPLMLACAGSILDQAIGTCLQASSIPMLGRLYPLSSDWFVDAQGRVGIGTTTPTQRLTVSGVVESASGGFKFPDGSLQSTALAGGGVPSGYMIVSDTPIAPPGYSAADLTIKAGDTWTNKTPMPTARYALAAAELNGKAYAIGGFASSSFLSTVEEYNPATNSWSAKASMPTARYYLVAASVGGQIYAIGGYQSGYQSQLLATVEAFDPVANAWVTKTPMPTPRYGCAAAVVDGHIFVIGGSGSTTTLTVVEEYDPVADTWITRAPMPTARSLLAAASVNGKIYAIGGSSGAVSQMKTVEEFNPATNVWTAKENMLTARYDLAAVSVDGRVFALGGSGANGYLDVLEEYNVTATNWSSASSMPTIHSGLGAVSLGGKVYAIGGANGSGLVSRVDAYDPNKATLYAFRKN